MIIILLFLKLVEKALIGDHVDKDDFLDINFTENDVMIEEFNQEFVKEESTRNEEFDTDSKNNIIEETHVSDKDFYISLQTIKDCFEQKEFNPGAMMGINYISMTLKKRPEKFNFDN